MEKGKYILSTFLLLVVLTSSLYLVLNDDVRIDIQKTRSIFSVNENGEWIVSGIEYVNLFDGSAKMRAKSRTLEVETFGEDTIVTRTAKYKNNILVSETYVFKSNTSDVTLFPISHEITVIGAVRENPEDPEYILQYEVQKLLYTGETIKDIESPQSFGHKMVVEWDDGNYYSRIFKYSGKDEGKLTIKYRIDSDRFFKNVRLFDPPENITVTLNSPVDNFESESIIAQFNCSADIVGGELVSNMSLYTNQSGVWSAKNTTETFGALSAYYELGESSGSTIGDSLLVNNGIYNNNLPTNVTGIIGDGQDVVNGDYMNFSNFFNISGDFTINFWHNREAGTGSFARLISYDIDGGSNAFNLLWQTTTEISFRATFAGSARGDARIGGISGWTMISLVRSGNTAKLYKNGVLGSTTTAFGAGAGPSLLFADNGFGTRTIDGKFDEIGLWERELNSTELLTLYNSGSGERPDFAQSSVTQTWTREISDSTLWSCEACDFAGDCAFSTENRTIFLDTTPPVISISYPENISYIINVSEINYTVTDNYLDKCWFTLDGGISNSTPVTSAANFTDVISVIGQNIATVYCNDTRSNIGFSSVTYTLDAIQYSSNSDPTNTTITGIGNVFINVSINPIIERKNISFRGYNLTDGVIVQYISDDFTDLTNNTTLVSTTNPFYWDVIMYDTDNVSYELSDRHRGIEIVNLSMNGTFDNIIVELGMNININATSNISYVYVDVDHPDYGVNYSSGFLNTSFELIIDYFRKNIFNDSTISKTLEFIGTQIKTIFFPAHQYDEVDNMSINITGINTLQYPENIQINKSNTTEIDRFFPGFLIGSNIYTNKLNTDVDNTSLFFTGLGLQIIEFFMDDGATLISMTFDITGLEFGFEYEDEFNDTSVLDEIENEGMFRGGFALPRGIDLTSFVYDNFTTSVTINASLWTSTINEQYVDGPPADRWIWRIENGYNGGMIIATDLDPEFNGGNHVITVNNIVVPNINKFNTWSTQEVDFTLEHINSVTRVRSDGICNVQPTVSMGGINIWTAPWQDCDDVLTSNCQAASETLTPLVFNLERNINNSWNFSISGAERTYGDDIDEGQCGSYSFVYNYTNGSLTKTYQFPGLGGCPFFDSVTDLSNSSIINGLSLSEPQFEFNTVINAFLNDDDPFGCSDVESIVNISVFNHSLYYLENSSIISNSIFVSSSDITKATINFSVGNISFIADDINLSDLIADPTEKINVTQSNTSIFSFLSSNNGENWESVTAGVEHSFTFTGRNMKYRYDFGLPIEGYITDLFFLLDMSIETPIGFPTNLSFDFGNDGIIDATFSGELNSSNPSLTIDVSSANISGAFSGFTTFDHLFEIPLKVSSDSTGEIFIDNFNLTYNPNPVILNSTSILAYLVNSINFIDFPISIESSGGNITVDDVRYDYAGGNDTIEILAHNADYSQNVTRNITYYYSRWDYDWGPTGVEWIYFAPNRPNAVNVTPYGQTTITPILNITNYGYGGKNATLSIFQDNVSACVNITMSLTNSKDDGIILNQSFIELTNLSYLESIDIYMWADYDCSFATWHLFEPNYYFRQCVDGGVCSTDLI